VTPVSDVRALRRGEELDEPLLGGGTVVARQQHRIALLASKLCREKESMDANAERQRALRNQG
jgi:hypothetical protein